MNILHVGTSSPNNTVNGVNYVVWQIAKEQVKLGHNVSILLNVEPQPETVEYIKQTGVELINIPIHQWGYEKKSVDAYLKEKAPQIVHMHSMFIPRQATLAKRLVQHKIPYVVTPHALSDQLLSQERTKKALYSFFLEKKRFSRASAITAVTPQEGRTIQNYVPRYNGLIQCIYNPINLDLDNSMISNLPPQQNAIKKIVYLGRFDVVHKGIDFLAEIAKKLPSDVEIHLYGTASPNFSQWQNQTKGSLSNNIHFHDPVFESKKDQVLSQASMYIQASRWEVFGISIAEAMARGIPCAISESVNLAEVFLQHNLGAVFPFDAQKAAHILLDSLNDRNKLTMWSKKASSYARDNFSPQVIANEYVNLYRQVS